MDLVELIALFRSLEKERDCRGALDTEEAGESEALKRQAHCSGVRCPEHFLSGEV